jgi:hypothetical protein
MSSFRLENNDSDNNSRLKSLEAKTSLLNTNPTRYSYTKFVSTSETVLNGEFFEENVIPVIFPLNGNYSPPNEAKEGSVYRLTISGRYTTPPAANSSITVNFLNSTRSYELFPVSTTSAFKLDILSVIKRFSSSESNIAIGYESSTISVSGQPDSFYSVERSYEPRQESELTIVYNSFPPVPDCQMIIQNIVFEKIA